MKHKPPDSLAASAHRAALWQMLASVACFTANVLLVRALSHDPAANMWLVTNVRFFVGLGVIYALYARHFEPARLVTSPGLIARGIIGAVGTYALYLAVQKIGAGRAIFIGNTYIVLAALLAAWLLHERLTRATVIGTVLSLFGLALLTNLFATSASVSRYDFVAIFSAVASAIVIVLVRKLRHTEHVSTIFGAQCVYGLLLCTGPMLFQWQPLRASSASLILIAGLCAAGGQLLMTNAFRALSVAEGSLIQSLTPVGITLGGVILFHERFHTAELIGAAFILIGTFLPVLPRPRITAPAHEPPRRPR